VNGTLAYTLVADGTTDSVLLLVLDWLLRQSAARVCRGTLADLRLLLRRPRNLTERIRAAVELYPCELLFVHRDAEAQGRAVRVQEITDALAAAPPAVCVVPVRMQEAWFLFNEQAIRKAAGKPNGRDRLNLPALRATERHADPKGTLYRALITASATTGRRRQHFPLGERARRLAELIDDYSPLRALPAFRSLEADLRQVLSDHGWQMPA